MRCATFFLPSHVASESINSPFPLPPYPLTPRCQILDNEVVRGVSIDTETVCQWVKIDREPTLTERFSGCEQVLPDRRQL